MSEVPSLLPSLNDPALQAFRQRNPHQGLLFHRWFPGWQATHQPVTAENVGMADMESKETVKAFVSSWKADANGITRAHARLDRIAHVTAAFETTGRLALGLGATHPVENGFSFEHITGAPVIPGSTLKGLARAYGALCGVEVGVLDTLFGRAPDPNLAEDTGEAGCVVFLDAWPKAEGLKLETDLVNPHEPGYYQDVQNPKVGAKHARAPIGTDSPVPSNFVAVRRGATYLIRLLSREKPEEQHLVDALALLTGALEDLGVGAKTAAGYGRMTPKGEPRFHGRTPEGSMPVPAPPAPATAPAPKITAGPRPYHHIWLNVLREVDRKGFRAAARLPNGAGLTEESLSAHPLVTTQEMTEGKVDWAGLAQRLDRLATPHAETTPHDDAPILLLAGAAPPQVWARFGARLGAQAETRLRLLHSVGFGAPASFDFGTPNPSSGAACLGALQGLPAVAPSDVRPVVLHLGPGQAPSAELYGDLAPDGLAALLFIPTVGELRPNDASAVLSRLRATITLIEERLPGDRRLIVTMSGLLPLGLPVGIAAAGRGRAIELPALVGNRYRPALTT